MGSSTDHSVRQLRTAAPCRCPDRSAQGAAAWRRPANRTSPSGFCRRECSDPTRQKKERSRSQSKSQLHQLPQRLKFLHSHSLLKTVVHGLVVKPQGTQSAARRANESNGQNKVNKD